MRRTLFIGLCICTLLSVTAFASGGGEEGETAEGKILPNMEGMRLVDEPLVMSAIVSLYETQSDPELLPFFQFIQDATGVDWEFETASVGDDYRQKLNLIFASGDLPDVVYGSALQSFIVEQAGFGNIVPYNELIEKYTKNIKEILAEREDIRRALTLPDGKIYSLWTLEEEEHYTWLDPYFVNQVWLARLGLSNPTSMEELHEVLIAFRDKDANGNGDPSDEIPFTWRETGWGGQRIDTFFGAFGIRDSADDNHVGYENGKAFITASDSRYRAALEYLHGLYVEGLVDPEAFTQDVAQLRAKAQANQVGVLIFFWPVNVLGSEMVNDYKLIPPLKGPANDPTAYKAYYISGWGGYQYLITSANPYPEVAIRYADLILDGGEMSLTAAFGPEGHYWESLPNGRWRLNEGKIPEGLGEVQHRAAATLFSQISYRDAKLYSRLEADPESKFARRLGWYRQVEPFIKAPAQPLFWFSQEESSEVASIAAELKSYVKEMRARFILDGVSDASWNEYVNNVESIGGKRLAAIYQGAYDTFYGN